MFAAVDLDTIDYSEVAIPSVPFPSQDGDDGAGRRRRRPRGRADDDDDDDDNDNGAAPTAEPQQSGRRSTKDKEQRSPKRHCSHRAPTAVLHYLFSFCSVLFRSSCDLHDNQSSPPAVR